LPAEIVQISAGKCTSLAAIIPGQFFLFFLQTEPLVFLEVR